MRLEPEGTESVSDGGRRRMTNTETELINKFYSMEDEGKSTKIGWERGTGKAPL